MVNAKLAVEAALKNKYDMHTIGINLGGMSQIKFINENSQEFIFETDASGITTCLLESGIYTVEVNGVVISKDFAVEADTEFNINGET